jgi:hypothetical protein
LVREGWSAHGFGVTFVIRSPRANHGVVFIVIIIECCCGLRALWEGREGRIARSVGDSSVKAGKIENAVVVWLVMLALAFVGGVA